MKKKVIFLGLLIFILVFPIFGVSTRNQIYNEQHFLNFTQRANDSPITVFNTKKIEYNYLYGNYWSGEISIKLTIESNSVISLISELTKKPNNGMNAPSISNSYPLNNTFSAQIYGFSTNFSSYFDEANISHANTWQSFKDPRFQSPCSADCNYYTHDLSVLMENGTIYSVSNQIPYPPSWKMISDNNSEYSLNYSSTFLKLIISQYNLTKLQNGQTTTLGLDLSSSGQNQTSPAFQLIYVVFLVPILGKIRLKRRI